ncbi:hypothetical protein G7054_g2278 [Neopestalotiopsis clavispora]|nr:hypothetical protein G7054_g2278 [Neopestalotiopsis clavispora]
MRLKGLSQLLSSRLARILSPNQPEAKPFEKVFGTKIWQCEEATGYRIKSRLLFAEALNASKDEVVSTVLLDGRRIVVPDNMRLAIYGDSIIQVFLCKLWLCKGPGSASKEWTRICQEVLSNDNLIKTAALDSHSKVKPKATLVEAVLGAIHLEGGDAALGRAMKQLGLTSHQCLPKEGHVAAFRDQTTDILQRARNEVKVFLGTAKPTILDNYTNERRHKSHVHEAGQAPSGWGRFWPF